MTRYSKDYSDKLKNWNGTTKYIGELQYLSDKMQLRQGQKVLDYGCGIGTAIKHFRDNGIHAYGYDANVFPLVVPRDWVRDEYFFQFDAVYMMHSIAHIKDAWQTLRNLKQFIKPNGKLYIITPNRDWLVRVNNGKDIKTDKTVVQHYDENTLRTLVLLSGFRNVQVEQFGVESYPVEDYRERLFLSADL